MRWLLKAAGLPLALVPSVALPLVLVAAAEDSRSATPAAEEAYRALPELPSGAAAETADDLEAEAVELAASLRAVPLSETAEETCPADRLAVSWTAPGDAYQWGAHVDPVGPAPGAGTTAVNGVVVCEGSEFAFMGFEAWRTQGEWQLAAVPYVREEAEEHHDEPAIPAVPAVPATPAVPPKPAPAPPALPNPLSLDLPAGAIEGYAAYEPQRLCDPTPKPGTLALRNLLLGTNPGTRNLGISRACGAGGQSEHKEGRALDWGVLVTRPNEAAAAERFVGQLMATDDQGNRHALARRMGVMYVIWNRKIWSSYRAAAGWRAYGGPSPHTDHVHVSLSWAGAQGRTSFWSGKVDPSTLLAHQPPAPSGGGAPVAAPVSNRRSRGNASLPGTLPTEAVHEAMREGGRRGRDRDAADRRRRWEELSEEERQALLTRRAEAEQEWREERERRREAREAERQERKALREAERARWRAEHGEHRRWDDDEHDTEDDTEHEAEAPFAADATQPQPEASPRRGWEREGHHLAEAERRAESQRRAEAQRQRHAEREAQKQAEREAEQQRRAEAHQQREAQKQAEQQRRAEAHQQREAQKQAERQRRAEVERQRGEHREVQRGERRRRDDRGEVRGHGGERRGGHGGGEHRGKGGDGHRGGRGKGRD